MHASVVVWSQMYLHHQFALLMCQCVVAVFFSCILLCVSSFVLKESFPYPATTFWRKEYLIWVNYLYMFHKKERTCVEGYRHFPMFVNNCCSLSDADHMKIISCSIDCKSHGIEKEKTALRLFSMICTAIWKQKYHSNFFITISI